MPNRIIKESICTSSEIDILSPEEEVFFYRLIVICDDYGRADARSAILRAKCFPLKVDRIKVKDIDSWLKRLIEVGLIIVYEVENKRYLQMATWHKHQQIRASKSKFPEPEQGKVIDINGNQLQSNVPVIDIRNRNRNRSTSDSNNKPEKNKYAEFVSMTEEEYQKLVSRYGSVITKRMIEVLDNYKGANGKKYASDYRAILNWVAERVKNETRKTEEELLSPAHRRYEG
jgi:hypothetical protein